MQLVLVKHVVRWGKGGHINMGTGERAMFGIPIIMKRILHQ